MPSRHAHPPISYRPPELLRNWLDGYAERHDRSVRGVITEALEEYKARREQEDTHGMRAMATETARDHLHRAFTYDFMQPEQPAWAPIWFPGIEYTGDGALTDNMKAKATEHLIEVLRQKGCVIRFSDEADASGALHHVLWDQWTKGEIGNGRFAGRLIDDYGWFTGRLFDEHGRIYHGCTAIEAANYTLERLAALGGVMCSYARQEGGVMGSHSQAAER
jgi:hypothetical protein